MFRSFPSLSVAGTDSEGSSRQVLRFFEDPLCCTLVELSRLWSLLQRTSVVQIKEAVMDAFRAMKWEESGAGETETGEEGLGLQLIGGWTYKVQLSREMEWKEWGHIYDLVRSLFLLHFGRCWWGG